MIPLDRHFNELLNETVPFPLPIASGKTTPKVVPAPAAAAKSIRFSPVAETKPVTTSASAVPQKPVQPMPEISETVAYSMSSYCCSTATEFAMFIPPELENDVTEKPAPVEIASKPKPVIPAIKTSPKITSSDNASLSNESPRSKVEIAAERAVPFKIDTRMLINRPRLTLRESGLPIALRPAEPDPSIVGESVLGFKHPSSTRSLSREALSREREILGEISEEIVDLLEQKSEASNKPALKAFNPEEKAFNPEEWFAETPENKSASTREESENHKTLSAWLYENSCEMNDDELEEYDLAEEDESIENHLSAEEIRVLQEIEEAQAIEACELDDDLDEIYEEVIVDEESSKAPKAFFPLLQVDRFAWPDFCQNMHPIIKTQLTHLGNELIAKSASGRKVIAVVGSSPKSGSTSILLGLATSLEAAGHRVALVDANLNSPTLADSLGLQPEQGWETVVSGKFPVQESLIDSLEDRIALLPLCLNKSQKLTFAVRPSDNERMNEAMRQMKDHYDLVLVDLGSPAASDIAAFSNMSEWIDSAVVVHNLRDSSRKQLIQMKNLMRDYNVSVAGIAENFAPREACFEHPDHRAA